MSRALLRFIRLSPTKARLVAREVQGMNAELALASLEFTPNKAAKVIYKVIASAVANGSYEGKKCDCAFLPCGCWSCAKKIYAKSKRACDTYTKTHFPCACGSSNTG